MSNNISQGTIWWKRRRESNNYRLLPSISSSCGMLMLVYFQMIIYIFLFNARWEIWFSGSFSAFLVSQCVCFYTTTIWWIAKGTQTKLLPITTRCLMELDPVASVDCFCTVTLNSSIMWHCSACFGFVYFISSCNFLLRCFWCLIYDFHKQIVF